MSIEWFDGPHTTYAAALLSREPEEGDLASFLKLDGTLIYYKFLGGQWVHTGTVEPLPWPPSSG